MSEKEYEPSGNFYLDYKHLANGLKRGDPKAIAHYNKQAAENGWQPWSHDDPLDDDPGVAMLVGSVSAAIVMAGIFAIIRYVM